MKAGPANSLVSHAARIFTAFLTDYCDGHEQDTATLKESASRWMADYIAANEGETDA